MKKRKSKIIFLHIPKAGGTSLRNIFKHQYRHLEDGEFHTINRTKQTAQFIALPGAYRKSIKVLVGHFSYGIHEYLEDGFQYVTFLRHPVSRTISAYNYSKSNPVGDVYDAINDNNLTLDEYLDNMVEPWMFNAMTKHLSGCTLEEFKLPADETMYQRALQNIADKFLYVGFTEQFDQSILKLRRLLNWSIPYYTKRNITNTNHLSDVPSDSLIKKIEHLNHYDMMLYEYYLNTHSANFKDALELKLFRILNYLHSRYQNR